MIKPLLKKITSEMPRQIKEGTIFVIMPMDVKIHPELLDTFEAIKAVGRHLNLDTKRIDEDISTLKITPRILNHLETSEFIIADLTFPRPNVYYEIGYAHGFMKGCRHSENIIFIAKTGTDTEFDIEDSAIHYFTTYVELRLKLTETLTNLIHNRNKS